MHLVDMHCYRRTLGIYCHMALDLEGAAQPPTVWRSTSNYIVYELETDTGLKGIGEISDFRDNIGQLDPPQLRCLFLAALKGIDLRHRRRAWEAVRQALPPSLPAEFRQLVAASVDIALLDLAGKYFGAPAYELLGGRVREVVPVSWVSYMRPAALLEDEIKEKINAKLEIEKSLISLEHEYTAQKLKLSNQKKSVDILLDVPCGDMYPSCKFIKDSHKNKNKIDSQDRLVSSLLDQTRATKKACKVLDKENLEGQLEKYDLLLEKLNKLKVSTSKKKVESLGRKHGLVKDGSQIVPNLSSTYKTT